MWSVWPAGAWVFPHVVQRGELGAAELFACAHKETIKVTDVRSGDGFAWSPALRIWQPVTAVQIESRIGPFLEGVLQKQRARLQAARSQDAAPPKSEDHNASADASPVRRGRAASTGQNIQLVERVLAAVRQSRHSTNVFKQARTLLLVPGFKASLNTDKDALPIADGLVIDLKTGHTRQRTTADPWSFNAPVRYAPELARGPNIMRFVNYCFIGQPEMVVLLQKLTGYLLTGHQSDRSVWLFIGAGRNGKSKYLTLLAACLCELYKPVARSVMIQTREAAGGAASPQIAALVGARVGCYTETNPTDSWETAFPKAVSGGDSIAFRPLFKDQQHHTFDSLKLVLATNFRPKFCADDRAFVDRLRLMEWTTRFVDTPAPGTNERKADEAFIEALTTQHLSEFFSWAVDGAIAWHRDRRLDLPPAAVARLQEYVSSQNPILAFAQDECEFGAGDEFTASALPLYEAYKAWARRAQPSGRALSNPAFKQHLLLIPGVSERRRAGGIRYVGIRIGPAVPPPPTPPPTQLPSQL